MGLVNSKYVKIIDPPEQNPFPAQRTIGRVFIGDELERALVRQGAEGAARYWDRVLPFYQSRPWVWAWEGPNEPGVASPQAITNLVDFTRQWGKMMRDGDLRSVGLNLSVGWPRLEDADLFVPVFPFIDYIDLHEYSAPTMQHTAGHLCLRYRQTYEIWREIWATPPPKLFIGECGIDGGVISQPRKGWKTFGSQAKFADQLEWYNRELERDAFVEAAFIFTSGPHQDWKDFDFNESLSCWLSCFIDNDKSLESVIIINTQASVIPQNPAAAFYIYGWDRMKWAPIGPEVRIENAGQKYVAQRWYEPATQMQHILYCLDGHWHDIRVIDRPN